MVAAYQSSAGRSEQLGGDPVVPKPTGTVAGDLLIAVGCTNGSGNPITAPAGWTQHANSLSNDNPLWTKIAGGVEPASYTFTVANIANSIVVIIRVSGHNPTTPVDVASGVTGTGNLVIPSLNSGGAARLLLQIVVKQSNVTFTGPGSQTERVDATVAAMTYGYAAGDETVGAGATGSRTWTPSGGAGIVGVGYMLAIGPASTTLAVTGFAPAVVFGTVGLRQTVTVTGFAPAVVFGTPTVIGDQFLPVTGFTVPVVFGAPSLVVEVAPAGFTPTVVFGTPTLIQDQFVTPPGFGVPVVFGSPTLGQYVTVDGFTVPVLFGTADPILDNVLTVTGFTPTIVFGVPDVDRQPFVTATVYNHETGDPLGAGATVQLFDENGTLLDTTTTDVNGDYIFYLPPGFTDDVFTVVRVTIGLDEYQGVSEICAAQT